MVKKVKWMLPVLTLLMLLVSLPVQAEDSFQEVSANMKGAVKVDSTMIYKESSKKSEVLQELTFGDKVNIKQESKTWYEVKKGSVRGYVRKTDVVKYDKTKKHVALTFDDGPGANTTGKVLDALEKYGCRATFFVVGSNINDKTGKLLKREAELGCEIGNHSYSHANLASLSSSAIKNQLAKTDKKVKKYTGKKPALCRTPYGAGSKTVLKAMGRPNILWSVDTLDWKYRNTKRLVSYVKKQAKDGSIILMHDIHKSTANAVDQICKNLKKANFETVTVTELSAIKGKKMKSAKSYGSF
jgi:peptidoglycan/xylan/chitin deacetylase (PgdA/CDA1 family)